VRSWLTRHPVIFFYKNHDFSRFLINFSTVVVVKHTHVVDPKLLIHLTHIHSHRDLGLLVDSEIVLSTRYGKVMVFINKTLSTENSHQQDLINRDLLSTRLIVGKVGSGMWCVKFNRTFNVLVCETQRNPICMGVSVSE
jgi:hypothetical protein